MRDAEREMKGDGCEARYDPNDDRQGEENRLFVDIEMVDPLKEPELKTFIFHFRALKID
jgi:hypothetical protein